MDLFTGVAHALAGVGVWRPELANDCGLVAHGLFVRALYDDAHLSVRFQRDAAQWLDLNRVAESELERDALAVLLKPLEGNDQIKCTLVTI